MPTPLEALRQRNAAQGKPAQVTAGQKGGIGGAVITAAAAFGLIMQAVYKDEGGYVNDPADRGGATNYGVTEAVARQNGYLGPMKAFPKHCYDKPVCADKIYNEIYVKRPGFEPMLAIEPAVADKLINTGINMGPKWPISWFQLAIKAGGIDVDTDAKMGPKTVAAYRALQVKYGKVKACYIALDALVAGQKRRYAGIIAANPSQVRFRNGWNTRANAVHRDWCGRGEAA